MIKDFLNKSDSGEIISIDVVMSKGIAYKDWFKNDWRNEDQKSICHTGLSHILSIFYFLCDDQCEVKLDTKVFFNKESKCFDLGLASSNSQKPLFKGIFSWGAPLINCRVNIITTNSLIKLEDNNLVIKYPRDSYDQEGNFKSPDAKVSQNITSKGIEPSLKSFFKRSRELIPFDEKSFHRALKIGRDCINAEIII